MHTLMEDIQHVAGGLSIIICKNQLTSTFCLMWVHNIIFSASFTAVSFIYTVVAIIHNDEVDLPPGILCRFWQSVKIVYDATF